MKHVIKNTEIQKGVTTKQQFQRIINDFFLAHNQTTNEREIFLGQLKSSELERLDNASKFHKNDQI